MDSRLYTERILVGRQIQAQTVLQSYQIYRLDTQSHIYPTSGVKQEIAPPVGLRQTICWSHDPHEAPSVDYVFPAHVCVT